jgi:glyoxylase-like metal-dependent hydrolase (beta-lactamase superfamily II)
MKEHEIVDLGIFRIPLPIPFRQAGGPVNAYVIEAEHGLLLYDPGLGTESSQAAFAEGLSRTGHRFDEVTRIILSHGHLDHFGAAVWVTEQIGRETPACIHSADADKVLESGADWPSRIRQNAAYLQRLGMPSPTIEATAAGIARNVGLGLRLSKISPLLPGEQIQCKKVTLEVHHMPGHTPGLCCLYERNHGLLFSADHILERVSPNPSMDLRQDGEPSSFRPLVTYFESLERVRSLAPSLVLPGHAAPFENCFDVLDTLYRFYQRRWERILEILGRKSLTAYEIMQELFLSGEGFELVMMLSEVLGNMEMLEQRGEVVRETEGALIRFRRT